MVWEKEILKGLNEDDITDFIDYAHKTKSVAECYRPVRELVDVDVIKEYLPGVWVSLIKVGEYLPARARRHGSLPWCDLLSPSLSYLPSFLLSPSPLPLPSLSPQIKEAHYKALAHYYAGLTHWQLAFIYGN